MCERRLDGRGLSAYRAYLIQEERAPSTVEKYLRDGRAFAAWLGDAAVSREAVSAWKANLLAMGAGMVGPNLALRMLEVFLATEFEGGRHQRRVDKITALEA